MNLHFAQTVTGIWILFFDQIFLFSQILETFTLKCAFGRRTTVLVYKIFLLNVKQGQSGIVRFCIVKCAAVVQESAT